MSRRRRSLTAEERDLWEKVTERTTPLHPGKPPRPHQLIARPKPADPAPAPTPAIAPFRIGEAHSHAALPNNLMGSVSDRLTLQPVLMDGKTFARLRKGKLTPEAHLDLHGKTLDAAHAELTRFILGAYGRQLRLVLVITGKGKPRAESGPIPVRRGVLKHQVPHWLSGPGLAHAVLQVSEAHLRHGGAGAYYVYLRRHRQ